MRVFLSSSILLILEAILEFCSHDLKSNCLDIEKNLINLNLFKF